MFQSGGSCTRFQTSDNCTKLQNVSITENLFPRIRFRVTHAFSLPPREKSVATDPAGSALWHHQCNAGFRCMQNVRTIGSGRLPLRVQKKVWEARQCALLMAWQEAMRMKPKVQ